MKGCTPRHLLSITSQVGGGYPGERRGRGGKKGERKTIGTWPTSTSPAQQRWEERGETVKKEDASAGLTCGDWTCSALSTLSITQIIRSEKWSGREEGRSV